MLKIVTCSVISIDIEGFLGNAIFRLVYVFQGHRVNYRSTYNEGMYSFFSLDATSAGLRDIILSCWERGDIECDLALETLFLQATK